MNNKKIKIILYIIFSISILATVLVLISLFCYKIKVLGLSNKWTNTNIIIEVKSCNNCLYSFNESEFSFDNTYTVEENRNIIIRVKKNNKIYYKNIKIDNIDKSLPVINNVDSNYNMVDHNITFKINASDSLSGILKYIYIIDDKIYETTSNSYEIKEKPKSLVIKIVDKALNEIIVDSLYYDKVKGEVNVTKSDTKLTNKDVILKVVKEPSYLQYSFSLDNTDNYNNNDTYVVSSNGTIYIKIKTNKDILTKEIVIDNIDKESPNIEYQKELIDNKVKLTIKATDNRTSNLLYSFNGSDWVSNNEIVLTKNYNNYIVKVKDEAANEKMVNIKINEIGTTIKKEDIYPTLNISYSTDPAKEVTINVDTNGSLISYNNDDWTTNKSIVLTDNVSNYSVRVKNNEGFITEKKITITNIVKEKTYKEKATDLINEISNIYGFKVDYGTGTYCWYNGNSCTLLYDDEKAYNALNTLKSGLAIFPNNFFRTFQGKNGYRISLFDDIPGEVAGLASYEIGDDNRMMLDVNAGFLGRVFYHETWHIMEKYIEWESYGKTDPWNNWTILNPIDFSYGNSSDNVFTIYDTNIPNNICFISSYAKTNNREDKAELFADLMFRAYKHNYMNSGYCVNEKAKYMANVLKNYFSNSVGAKWEQWITF